MTAKKITQTVAKNIRARIHPTRKLLGGRADRYFSIRCAHGSFRRDFGIGWASEGVTLKQCISLRELIVEALERGERPHTIADITNYKMSSTTNNETVRATHSNTHPHDIALLSLSVFFDTHYLPDVQARKRTWSHDLGRFDKTIRPIFGDYPLQAITRSHINELLHKLRSDGISEATCLQYMALLRQIYNLARITVINGQPLYTSTHTPLDGIRMPKAVIERERFLTFEEADKLVDAAKTEAKKKHDSGQKIEAERTADVHDLIVITLNTGLRFGELLRLRWSDISIHTATCSIPHEDMRKPGGRIPVNAEALAIFISRWQASKKRGQIDTVFSPVAGGKDGNIYRRIFRQLVDSVDLNLLATGPRDRVVFHTLRHTFASWLAISGHADIYRIKTLMRHRTMAMTERYAHLLPDATRAAVNNIRQSKN